MGGAQIQSTFKDGDKLANCCPASGELQYLVNIKQYKFVQQMHWLRDVLSEIRQSAKYNNRMTHQVVNCSCKLFSFCRLFIKASIVFVVLISSMCDLFVLLTVHGIYSHILITLLSDEE